MKYLVIGGAGFVGSHFAEALLAGNHEVTVFDDLSAGSKKQINNCFKYKKFRFIQADLFHKTALRNAMHRQHCIFHFATNSDLRLSAKDPSVDIKQNIQATFEVLEQMRLLKIKPIVYFSGSGVYGAYGSKKLRETQGAMQPVSMYGATKLSCEALLMAYKNLYGVQPYIFRPGNIIGERMTHGVIFDLIHKLKKNPGKLKVLGNGEQDKSYIHIEDILSAVFLCLRQKPSDYPVWNVSSETNIKVKTIVGLILKAMDLRAAKISYDKTKAGWPGDVTEYRMDLKALKSLGWKPQYSSKQAVVKAIQSRLNELNEPA